VYFLQRKVTGFDIKMRTFQLMRKSADIHETLSGYYARVPKFFTNVRPSEILTTRTCVILKREGGSKRFGIFQVVE
jgi:hypothetical protein